MSFVRARPRHGRRSAPPSHTAPQRQPDDEPASPILLRPSAEPEDPHPTNRRHAPRRGTSLRVQSRCPTAPQKDQRCRAWRTAREEDHDPVCEPVRTWDVPRRCLGPCDDGVNRDGGRKRLAEPPPPSRREREPGRSRRTRRKIPTPCAPTHVGTNSPKRSPRAPTLG